MDEAQKNLVAMTSEELPTVSPRKRGRFHLLWTILVGLGTVIVIISVMAALTNLPFWKEMWDVRPLLLFEAFIFFALAEFFRAGRASAHPKATMSTLIASGIFFTSPAGTHGTLFEGSLFFFLVVAIAAGVLFGFTVYRLRHVGAKRVAVVTTLLAAMCSAVVIWMVVPVWLDQADNPLIDQIMPSIALQTFDGAPIDQSAWRGHVIVLDLWATWCGPCRMEMPDIVALQRRYANDPRVVILTVNTAEGDTAEKAKAYMQLHASGVAGAIATDTNLRRSLGIGIPAIYLLDAQGHLRLHVMGYSPHMKSTVAGKIDWLLRQK